MATIHKTAAVLVDALNDIMIDHDSADRNIKVAAAAYNDFLIIVGGGDPLKVKTAAVNDGYEKIKKTLMDAYNDAPARSIAVSLSDRFDQVVRNLKECIRIGDTKGTDHGNSSRELFGYLGNLSEHLIDLVSDIGSISKINKDGVREPDSMGHAETKVTIPEGRDTRKTLDTSEGKDKSSWWKRMFGPKEEHAQWTTSKDPDWFQSVDKQHPKRELNLAPGRRDTRRDVFAHNLMSSIMEMPVIDKSDLARTARVMVASYMGIANEINGVDVMSRRADKDETLCTIQDIYEAGVEEGKSVEDESVKKHLVELAGEIHDWLGSYLKDSTGDDKELLADIESFVHALGALHGSQS